MPSVFDSPISCTRKVSAGQRYKDVTVLYQLWIKMIFLPRLYGGRESDNRGPNLLICPPSLQSVINGFYRLKLSFFLGKFINLKVSFYSILTTHFPIYQVDEKGVKAAAATVVHMCRKRCAPVRPQPRVFVADHPFLYCTSHNGYILFHGQFFA